VLREIFTVEKTISDNVTDSMRRIMKSKVKVDTKHHAFKTYGEWRYSSTHSQTLHKMVDSDEPWSLYLMGKEPWDQLDGGTDRFRPRSGHRTDEKNLFILPGIDPRSSSP
jgi:hypothetical protein